MAARLMFVVPPFADKVESPLSVIKITRGVQTALPQSTAPMVDNITKGIVTTGEGIPEAAAIDWQLVMMVIWAAGLVIVTGWLISVNVSFNKRLTESRSRLEYECTLPVYVSDAISSPCITYSGGEVAIYVTPEVAGDSRRLKYAVIHELCHEKHGDRGWAVLRCGLLAMYWFNPLVWVAAIMSKRDCELACDGAVIKEIGEENRLSYGRTLVELVGEQNKRKNIAYVATSMCGSEKGIRERVKMIAGNKKMLAVTLITVLLIASLAACATFTGAVSEPSDSGSKISAEDMEALTAFGDSWATAFSARDAETIYAMCRNEELYLTIGEVAANGERWMGMSSPWPWGEHPYVSVVTADGTINNYYYFQVSDPHVYVVKETLKCEKINGAYKAASQSVKEFNHVSSKEMFEEAYQYGYPVFADFAESYQVQADTAEDKRDIFCNPLNAAEEQLNITDTESEYVEYSQDGSAQVEFGWRDGSVTVEMIQPGVKGDKGIWIAVQ